MDIDLFVGIGAAVIMILIAAFTRNLIREGIPEELTNAMWTLVIVGFCLAIFYFAVTNLTVAIIVSAVLIALAINGRNKA